MADEEFFISTEEDLSAINAELKQALETLTKDEFFEQFLERGACYVDYHDGSRRCFGGVTWGECERWRTSPRVRDTSFDPRRPCPR